MLTFDDIELVKKVKNPPILAVLKALYTGLPIFIEGRKYVLAKTNNDGEMLVIEADCFDPATGKQSKTPIGIDATLQWLTEYANKLSEEQLTILSANTTFNYVK